MVNGIEAVVLDYIEESYSYEKACELKASLFVFEAFNYQNIYTDLADIFYDIESDDITLTQLKVLACITSALRYILNQHKVDVQEETTISVMNDMVSVLFRIQYLEDPTPVLKILEGMASNEEKLSKILSIYSTLDEVVFLENIRVVEDAALKSMAAYLYQLEDRIASLAEPELEKEKQRRQITELIKDFFKVHGVNNLAHQIASNHILEGFELHDYIPYVQHAIKSNTVDQTALNVLSLLYYASDTFTTPVQSFREHSEELGFSAVESAAVEAKMTGLIALLEEYRKAKDVSR